MPATTLLSSAETVTVWHLSLRIVPYAFLYTYIQWCAGKYLTTEPRGNCSEAYFVALAEFHAVNTLTMAGFKPATSSNE